MSLIKHLSQKVVICCMNKIQIILKDNSINNNIIGDIYLSLAKS